MSGNLKILGLALVAMGAMSAVVASSAAAAVNPTIKITPNYPLTLDAESTEHKFKAGEQEMVCKVSTFHATVAAATNTVTIAPSYHDAKVTDCTAGGFPATINENGCHYNLRSPATVPGTTHYSALVDLICPAPVAGIEVRMFAGHGHGFGVCILTIKAQTGLGPLTVKNNAATTDITLEGTLKGIHQAQSGLCGASTTTAAEYDFGVTTLTEKNGKPFHIG